MPYAWVRCLTLIVAVWTDVCDVCEHGLVTMTTTITTLHCGCTLTPIPTIPMTTSVKACAICGGDGSRATMTVTCPDTSAMASASRVTSLPAATGLAPAAGAIVGSGIGRNYGNTTSTSLPTNGMTNTGVAGGRAPSGADTIPASIAGTNIAGTAQIGGAPLMTSSTAASGSFGGPLVSGASSVSAVNASVARPIETFMLKSSNGAGVVLFNMREVVVPAMLVAILLA
jgi:hypothetical protein